jgi:hypothetical protein
LKKVRITVGVLVVRATNNLSVMDPTEVLNFRQ